MRKIFGTASLHRLSTKSCEKVIDVALNNGFLQFDTAGVYGLGATNKFIGRLGLSSEVDFSAKLGLKSSKTFGSSRTEVLLRKLLLPNASKIKVDNCYSSWKKQFETQLLDLRVHKVQRLLLHERFITLNLWEIFQKFINEYKAHFDEYGFSANWLTLRPFLEDIKNSSLLIQTTPDILSENFSINSKKITLYGISKVCNENTCINDFKKLGGLVYFSSKPSRIKNFSYKDINYNR